MKKTFKLILTGILAVAAVFACAFAVTGCGDEQLEPNTFYVTVVDASGKTITDAATAGNNGMNLKIQICQSQEGGACLTLRNVETDGTFAYTLSEGDLKVLGELSATNPYHLKIGNPKEGYSDGEIEVTSFGKYKITYKAN